MARLMMQVRGLLLQPYQPQILKLFQLYMNSILVTSVLQNRIFCKHVNIINHTDEVLNYKEYVKNNKPNQIILKNTLMEIFGLKLNESIKIINQYPELNKRSRLDILNNYYNLIEVGVQIDTIANNVWLLAHENKKLVDKLKCIKVLNMDINEMIPWLQLIQKKLENYVLYAQQTVDSCTYNKMDYLSYKLEVQVKLMDYLSHKLECRIQQLCEITVLNSFLMKIPVSSIEKKLNILHEYNVSNNDILKDVWILQYNENRIRQRCELYKKTGKFTETWVVRRGCLLKVTPRAQNNEIKHNLMQQKNVRKYLQNKLKVDEEIFNLAVKKNPSILQMDIMKLNQLINILQQNGITSNKILLYTQVFNFNIETIQNRIEIMKKENLHPNLALLIRSEQMFNENIEMNNIQRNLLEKYGSVQNYLINKLNVDEKLLKEAITKKPSILQKNLRKLNELIDLLQENGITVDDMVKQPDIFYFHIKTLRQVIDILKEDGVPLRVSSLIHNRSIIKSKSCNSKNINK